MINETPAFYEKPCNGINAPFTAYALVATILWRDDKAEAGSLGFFTCVGVEVAIVVLTVATLVESVVRNLFAGLLVYVGLIAPSVQKFSIDLTTGSIAGYKTCLLGAYGIFANIFADKIHADPPPIPEYKFSDNFADFDFDAFFKDAEGHFTQDARADEKRRAARSCGQFDPLFDADFLEHLRGDCLHARQGHFTSGPETRKRHCW